MKSGIYSNHILLILAVLLFLFCGSPIQVSLWQLTEDSLQPTAWKSASPLPAPPKQTVNEMKLEKGSVTIFSQSGAWKSPAAWQVQHAIWTDLNHNGEPELTLLVRRPFEPWPVDRVLPHGGRIQSHQDNDGMSSHIIMIGWKKDHWGEVWAGSALARPVYQFDVADLNQDGKQELVVLEGNYDNSASRLSDSLAIWKWDGFGFELISRVEKPAHGFMILETNLLTKMILLN